LWHVLTGWRESHSRDAERVLKIDSQTEPAKFSVTLDKPAEFRL